jgi:hypothetical protein
MALLKLRMRWAHFFFPNKKIVESHKCAQALTQERVLPERGRCVEGIRVLRDQQVTSKLAVNQLCGSVVTVPFASLVRYDARKCCRAAERTK